MLFVYSLTISCSVHVRMRTIRRLIIRLERSFQTWMKVISKVANFTNLRIQIALKGKYDECLYRLSLPVKLNRPKSRRNFLECSTQVASQGKISFVVAIASNENGRVGESRCELNDAYFISQPRINACMHTSVTNRYSLKFHFGHIIASYATNV